VLEVEAERLREHDGFEIAAAALQAIGIVAVRDRQHLLGDDRALVEIGSHVVRGRSDDLHAAFVGLGVGARPGELRKERMMDVDHPAFPRVDEPGWQHAHVPREHDDVGRRRVEHRAQRALLLAPVVADRYVAKLDVEPADERGMRLVIRRDEHDLTRELAQRVAHQEVGQAVPLARREHGDARSRLEIVQ